MHEVPPGPLLLSEKELWFAPQLKPGTHSQLGGLVGVGGRQKMKNGQYSSVSGS